MRKKCFRWLDYLLPFRQMEVRPTHVAPLISELMSRPSGRKR